MDEQDFLYFSDSEQHEVRRVKLDEPSKIFPVAGGHGCGSNLDQLSYPTCLLVDRERALYVADSRNHRMIRWSAGAKEGENVAGGNGVVARCTRRCRLPQFSVVDQ